MDNKIKFVSILAIGLVLILIVIILLQILNVQPIVTNDLKKFNSISELKNFLEENSQESYGYQNDMMVKRAVAPTFAGAASESTGADSYSQTNIQVEGVDEPDIVKNDGKYIYAVAGNKVEIVEAYPAEDMSIIGEIDVNKSISDIFLNNDKLIVFSQGYYNIYETNEAKMAVPGVACLGCGSSTRTQVFIYDISDKANPVLDKSVLIEGNYIESRMIDNYVYIISQKSANVDNPEPPIYVTNGVEKEVPVTSIYYPDYQDYGYVFSSIMALNIDSGDTNVKTFLTGYSGIIYVSENNVYLTHTRYLSYKDHFAKYVDEVILNLLPNEERNEVEDIMISSKSSWEKSQEVYAIITDYSNSLSGDDKENFDEEFLNKTEEFNFKMQKENEKTTIYKIEIENMNVNYQKSGEVPGHVLNQFSMDEYNGKFRIATTTGDAWSGTSLNHLYVLNNDMKIVGSVEDLAAGEKIYSARFMGKRAYIVTFKKVDPLFVVDLSNNQPEVLGYLKITGYSDYLHPYDETHIIGVGKEAQGGEENFAWYQGMKVSLFDVSDVENPVEVGKIEIGDRGTNSEALSDHKAFMFDKSRNLLVLPISEYKIDESKYTGEIPDNAYGEFVWQGAYVLNINLDGIRIRGKITHDAAFDEQYKGGYWTSNTQIRRSLYMDDILYTISNSMIKANNLSSLDEINSVDLPHIDYPVYAY